MYNKIPYLTLNYSLTLNLYPVEQYLSCYLLLNNMTKIHKRIPSLDF